MRNSPRSWCTSHQLLAYFLLVFVGAWLVWLPMVASARGLIGLRFPGYLIWAAGLAPIGAATIVELVARGREGLRSLYGRFLIKGVSLRWYAIAATLPVILALVPSWIQQLATGQHLTMTSLVVAVMVLGKGILYSPVAAFEEVGWRGFALPRLQSRTGALSSSLALGLVWAVWHLPLFWLGGPAYSQMGYAWWIVDVLAVATLITWLFNNGGGSLWLPCLFHGVANVAIEALAAPIGSAIGPLVAVAATLAVVAAYGPRNLSRSGARVQA